LNIALRIIQRTKHIFNSCLHLKLTLKCACEYSIFSMQKMKVEFSLCECNDVHSVWLRQTRVGHGLDSSMDWIGLVWIVWDVCDPASK